ncbi:MAG: ribosome-associated protein [Bacteroidota bacterium]
MHIEIITANKDLRRSTGACITYMKITTPYIHLNALLKLLGWVETGADANNAIDNGLVKVNGQTETRRRNKIYPGMVVAFENRQVTIE